jgi:hypothetical protein
MKNDRFWWMGGFLAGLLVGLGLSLAYTWVLDPPPLTMTTPAALNPHDREVYTVLVAAAYAADGNLDQAEKRLARLEDPDIENVIVHLAERHIREGRDVRDVRALARLANGLGRTSAAVRPFIATPSPTSTPSPTATPRPPTPTRTATVTATSSPTSTPRRRRPTATATAIAEPSATPRLDVFRVVQSTALCDSKAEGLLRVYVRDGAGEPVSGVEVLVDWPGGEDRFFTGFKTDIDAGYADFGMRADEVYRVELVSVASEVAEDIGGNAEALCPDLPADAQLSWQVVFQLP